ncbi:MAG: HAD family phosphatase [Deltaproteobacteria bacterium]|nr:MAG: HAD family phosphatase [Deltaproteobacteria bacterium]
MSTAKRLEAVLFDMDGVIIDSEPLWTEAEIQFLARRSLSYSPQLKAVLMGRDSREAVGILIEHYNLSESVDDVIEERNELVAGLFRELLQPIPYALDLVKSVRHSGVKTSMASSSPKRLIELVMDKFSIAGLFDLVLSGDQVARGKPAPDIYLTAARELGVIPDNCLVIEDAPNGVASAKAAGMRCLAISTSTNAAELAMADKVVRSFAEVDLQLLQDLVQSSSTRE